MKVGRYERTMVIVDRKKLYITMNGVRQAE